MCIQYAETLSSILQTVPEDWRGGLFPHQTHVVKAAHTEDQLCSWKGNIHVPVFIAPACLCNPVFMNFLDSLDLLQ